MLTSSWTKIRDAPQTRFPEDLLHHLVGLELLSGEVQRARLLALEPIVAEHGVDPEVAPGLGAGGTQ